MFAILGLADFGEHARGNALERLWEGVEDVGDLVLRTHSVSGKPARASQNRSAPSPTARKVPAMPR